MHQGLGSSMGMSETLENEIIYKNIVVIKEGEGYPVILVHGLNSSHEVWNGFCQRFPKGFALYRVKVKGFDGLELMGKPCMKAVRDDLMHLIQDHQLDRPVVVGHSLGGFLALWLTTKYDNTGPLIILDALPFMGGALNPFLTSATTTIFAQYMKSKVLSMAEKKEWKRWQLRLLSDMVTEKKDLKTVLNWSYKANKQMSAEAIEALFSTDLRRRLYRIKQRVLILATWQGYKNYGYRQGDIARIFNRQYRDLKNKELIISHTARHYMMLDDLDWMMAQINQFINELQLSAPIPDQADFKLLPESEKNFLASR